MAVQLVSVLVEIVRPYLGYYGNLAEKIPALSGFWIISLILQMPITLFLCFNQDIYPLPLERFVYLIHFVLLTMEVGYFQLNQYQKIQVLISGLVIRRLANYQMALFKKRLEQEPNIQDS